MTKQEQAVETRRRVLAAAITTIRDHGVSAFTLDAVAREAGVSKGGLLHHFASKDVMVEAILRHLFADFEARVHAYYEAEPQQPGRLLRAYIRATYDESPVPLELAAMLMGAMNENRTLLTLIQTDFVEWQQRLFNDGVPKARVTIVRQAADAYLTERLLGVTAEQQTDRLDVLHELLQLTRVE